MTNTTGIATAATVENCPHLTLTDSHNAFPDRNHEDSLAVIAVKNPYCTATITPQGAQLLTFEQADGTPLLWLSPQAIFKTGKAIRGGVPVCLPWFGPHTTDPSKPQHGFARNSLWQLTRAHALDDGATQLTWRFQVGTSHPAQFAGEFTAELTMTLSKRIDLQLVVSNDGTHPLPLSWALHSYHPVNNLATARVAGLDGCEYLDNTRQQSRFTQTGDITFGQEVDRIFVSTSKHQDLITETQHLRVSGHDCSSAIIWNPGPQLAAGMADVGEGNHQGFVCVERGNTADNALRLAAGETHSASVRIEALT